MGRLLSESRRWRGTLSITRCYLLYHALLTHANESQRCSPSPIWNALRDDIRRCCKMLKCYFRKPLMISSESRATFYVCNIVQDIQSESMAVRHLQRRHSRHYPQMAINSQWRSGIHLASYHLKSLRTISEFYTPLKIARFPPGPKL